MSRGQGCGARKAIPLRPIGKCLVHLQVDCYNQPPFQAYGAAGVAKITRILERELITAMQLAGAARISDLTPELVRYEISITV